MATAVAFVNGAGMEVLLTVVSGEKVMLLLDSRKDAGGGSHKVCRCCHGVVAVNELTMVVQICVLGNDVKVMACCYGGAFSGKWWRFLAVAEQWLPALECDARVSGLWERWKMMTWQCLIGAYVFARINATWLVLIGQF